jgi:hypothetical protein
VFFGKNIKISEYLGGAVVNKYRMGLRFLNDSERILAKRLNFS